MDSGDYILMSGTVMDAWEERCRACARAGMQAPPRPHFMHSDLSSIEEIQQASMWCMAVLCMCMWSSVKTSVPEYLHSAPASCHGPPLLESVITDAL